MAWGRGAGGRVKHQTLGANESSYGGKKNIKDWAEKVTFAIKVDCPFLWSVGVSAASALIPIFCMQPNPDASNGFIKRTSPTNRRKVARKKYPGGR